MLFETSITIGNKKLVASHQFNVRFGESFAFHFHPEGESDFSIVFEQEFNPNKKDPYIGAKKPPAPGDDALIYVLGNFNLPRIITNPIPFYAKDDKQYSFQLSASSASSEITTDTIWLYTAAFYEEPYHGWQ